MLEQQWTIDDRWANQESVVSYDFENLLPYSAEWSISFPDDAFVYIIMLQLRYMNICDWQAEKIISN